MKCVFERAPGLIIVPVDENAEKLVLSQKVGQGFTVEARKARNIKFHRLFFALLNMAYDMWNPPEPRQFRGVVIAKNFERFREEVLILAGHYDATYSLEGSVQLKAKSISFSSLDEHDFKGVYESVLTVVWERIFREANFRSKEEVDAVVHRMLAFG